MEGGDEEKEEKPRWRTRLTIKMGGKVCVCISACVSWCCVAEIAEPCVSVRVFVIVCVCVCVCVCVRVMCVYCFVSGWVEGCVCVRVHVYVCCLCERQRAHAPKTRVYKSAQEKDRECV